MDQPNGPHLLNVHAAADRHAAADQAHRDVETQRAAQHYAAAAEDDEAPGYLTARTALTTTPPAV